jgi:hypothetical protein
MHRVQRAGRVLEDHRHPAAADKLEAELRKLVAFLRGGELPEPEFVLDGGEGEGGDAGAEAAAAPSATAAAAAAAASSTLTSSASSSSASASASASSAAGAGAERALSALEDALAISADVRKEVHVRTRASVLEALVLPPLPTSAPDLRGQFFVPEAAP